MPIGSARGPIPISEALPIARQIAEALEAAHERGVVHRDLSAMATGAGVILGTAAYMSPEQARGKAVDKRADVWAFGCVLYEMLTGKRAFEGEEVSDTLAAILRGDPNWDALPPNTPATIRRLLRRCLDKDPRERLHDISDARFELKEAIAASRERVSTVALPVAAARTLPRWRGVAMLALGLVAGGALAATTVSFATRPHPTRVARLTITPSGAAALFVTGTDRDLAISADGTRVVFVGGNGSQLFTRALDQLEPLPLSGVGAPHHPFISSDGEWIGYFDGASGLKKVSVSGGPPITICRCASVVARGATWGPDDTIIFCRLVRPPAGSSGRG